MNPKEVIEVLEQNNITLALLCDESSVEKELARTQIEMNNMLINQLKMMLEIEKL